MADPKNILALFADEEEVHAVGAVLRERGFRVEHAPSVYAAVAAFAKTPFEVLLLDMDVLTERDLEIVEIARAEHPDVYILAVFSITSRERAVAALRRGADAQLLKPFYYTELTLLLDRSGRRTEARADEPADAGAGLAKIALGVAHEVNNPLATLSGYLDMLATDTARPPAERKQFASLKEEADRIAVVVRELSAFAEQRSPAKAPLSLNELVAEALQAAEEADPDGPEVARSLQDDLPRVDGDKRQLLQMWRMLLDYMRSAKTQSRFRLEVSTFANGSGYVGAVVSDPGRVIPADRLARLFDPFGVTSEEDDSAGLSLAICRGILARHGGKLSGQSESGKGTRFTILLPVHQES